MPRGGRRKGAATLSEVARDAGVSIATASRVLNDGPRSVTEELRERVVESAARLNYSKNVSAQSVARGRSTSLALVVRDISDPYFSAIASGVFRGAEDVGSFVTVAASDRRFEEELSIVSVLRGQRPSCMVVAGSRSTDRATTARFVEQLKDYEREGGHVVLISQAGLPFDTINIENHRGAHDLTVELLHLGYRRFAVLAGPRDLRTARDRLAGVEAALDEAGITLASGNIVHCDFTRDGGYAAAGELLTRYTQAEIILAVNDVMALGAMARLREAGLSVPRDFAVAGFDDVKSLRDVNPPLTTYRLPLVRVGAAAARQAFRAAPGDPRLEHVLGEVVVRASTPRVDR